MEEMDIRDLGDLTGPVLLFGGPYGNKHALDALLDAAKTIDIPPDHMICTGDLAAYAADPEGVAQMLHTAGVPIVMGNVEESLGFAIDDCQCGFEEGSTCSVLAAQWYRYGSDVVSDKMKSWMRTLPRRIDFTLSGVRFVVIHGGVAEINRFVFPATPGDVKSEEMALAGTQAIIGGHSGLPFTEVIDGRLWHNPGVIGLPANDGTPRVWYSVLTPKDDGIMIEIRALRYDHRAAATAIRTADLPNEYAGALESGLWPSDDIMPEGDRRRRGAAILPSKFTWQPPRPVTAAAE